MDHEIEPSRSEDSPLPSGDLPFQDLVAPEPIDAAPPELARWLAFVGILIGGLLGALVGFGVGDLMGGEVSAVVGAVVGGLTGAIGVGVLANLTLRAMNEWRTVEHPEARDSAAKEAAGPKTDEPQDDDPQPGDTTTGR